MWDMQKVTLLLNMTMENKDYGSKRIIFATKMDLSSEEYEHDLKMIKEMIEYLNSEDLTKYE